MDTVMERTAVAKAKGRPKSARSDVSVKVDRAVVGMAKLIATHRGVSLAELLSETLRVPIEKAYAQMLRDLEGKR